jgi:hypothetical protein
MTKREQVARDYPLHYQRIVEIMFEQCEDGHGYLDPDKELDGPEDTLGLHCLFIWSQTTEGHRYWKALS